MILVKPSFGVQVDVTNPGQFFACCGLLELAGRIWPGAEGWFNEDVFLIGDPDGKATLEVVLDELGNLTVVNGPLAVVLRDGTGKPVEDPGKILPLCIKEMPNAESFRLSWWLDEQECRQSIFKMWSAHGTSLSIFSTLVQEANQVRSVIDLAAPFTCYTPSSTRFGTDPGAAWNTLDVGFSPNEQDMKTMSSPITELLAAIGLERFKPSMTGRERLEYCIWRVPLAPAVAAAAVAGLLATGQVTKYRFRIAARGKFKCFTMAIQEGGYSS